MGRELKADSHMVLQQWMRGIAPRALCFTVGLNPETMKRGPGGREEV